jgi:hypothetical protein
VQASALAPAAPPAPAAGSLRAHPRRPPGARAPPRPAGTARARRNRPMRRGSDEPLVEGDAVVSDDADAATLGDSATATTHAPMRRPRTLGLPKARVRRVIAEFTKFCQPSSTDNAIMNLDEAEFSPSESESLRRITEERASRSSRWTTQRHSVDNERDGTCWSYAALALVCCVFLLVAALAYTIALRLPANINGRKLDEWSGLRGRLRWHDAIS